MFQSDVYLGTVGVILFPGLLLALTQVQKMKAQSTGQAWEHVYLRRVIHQMSAHNNNHYRQ